MPASVLLSTDPLHDGTCQLPGRWSIQGPIALGAASLSLWLWLAFLRQRGPMGVAATVAVFAAAHLILRGAVLLAGKLDKTGSEGLRYQLARSSCAFVLLLLFVPEYAARSLPPGMRSALLLIIVSGLWLALLKDCLRRAKAGEVSEEAGASPWPLLGASALLVGLTWIAIRKFYVFGYVGQDLAYFAQIMHTTVHGHLFWGSLLQDLLYSHPVTTDFAGHNSPIMFLFLPFYALFPSPVTLLVFRNLAMLACAYPAYRIAALASSNAAARLWAAAFLLLPAIFYQSTFDFYPLSFAALPLLFTLLYYLQGRFRPFCISLVFTLMVREDLALFALSLACVALLQRKRIHWVAAPFVAGATWAAFSYLIVLPHALKGAAFVTDACFSHLGTSPSQMLVHVCRSPQTTVLAHGNIVYLKQLLTPGLLVLAFGTPVALASLPYLAINLLAGAGKCITTVIYAQYSVVPSTVLFVSTVLFFTDRGRRLARWGRFGLESDRAPALVVLTLCLATLVFVTGRPQLDELTEKSWTPEARQVASLIPQKASVAAPRYMLPALANRDCLYQTHRLHQYHRAVFEYLILDQDWSHINASSEYERAYRDLLQQAPKDPRFTVVYRSAGFTVLRDAEAHGQSCFPITQGPQR